MARPLRAACPHRIGCCTSRSPSERGLDLAWRRSLRLGNATEVQPDGSLSPLSASDEPVGSDAAAPRARGSALVGDGRDSRGSSSPRECWFGSSGRRLRGLHVSRTYPGGLPGTRPEDRFAARWGRRSTRLFGMALGGLMPGGGRGRASGDRPGGIGWCCVSSTASEAGEHERLRRPPRDDRGLDLRCTFGAATVRRTRMSKVCLMCV